MATATRPGTVATPSAAMPTGGIPLGYRGRTIGRWANECLVLYQTAGGLPPETSVGSSAQHRSLK